MCLKGIDFFIFLGCVVYVFWIVVYEFRIIIFSMVFYLSLEFVGRVKVFMGGISLDLGVIVGVFIFLG